MKFVLAIAGSDPTGGAGIQADLKTISALGCYGLSAITAITSQTTREVKGVIKVDPLALKNQIEHLYTEFKISAVKTGMLGSKENIRVISGILYKRAQKNVVVDPIIFSGSGVRLLDEDGIRAYKQNLLPLCTIVTPNLNEASILSGIEVKTLEEMIESAKVIAGFGPESVLVKGGHLAGDPVDVLYYNRRIQLLPHKRIHREVHGAGCALSSAIAVMLAKGYSIERSIRLAQNFTENCIRSGFRSTDKGKYLLRHL